MLLSHKVKNSITKNYDATIIRYLTTAFANFEDCVKST